MATGRLSCSHQMHFHWSSEVYKSCLCFQHYWRYIIRVAKKISVKESKTRI